MLSTHPHDLKKLERYDAEVRNRGHIEMTIVRFMLGSLLKQGFELQVDDGEEAYEITTDVDEMMTDIFGVDECYVIVYSPGRCRKVQLVFGNDGYDCIADYSGSLEEALAETNKFAETFE